MHHVLPRVKQASWRAFCSDTESQAAVPPARVQATSYRQREHAERDGGSPAAIGVVPAITTASGATEKPSEDEVASWRRPYDVFLERACSGSSPSSERRSASATTSIESRNTTWIPASHASLVLSYCSIFMNARNSWIAEMATIEVISLCLRPPKSTLVIQSGRSWSSASIRETKFS